MTVGLKSPVVLKVSEIISGCRVVVGPDLCAPVTSEPTTLEGCRARVIRARWLGARARRLTLLGYSGRSAAATTAARRKGRGDHVGPHTRYHFPSSKNITRTQTDAGAHRPSAMRTRRASSISPSGCTLDNVEGDSAVKCLWRSMRFDACWNRAIAPRGRTKPIPR